MDRLRRRPILIAGDLGRAIAIASIPIAFAIDALTIWQLYVVGFVNGCLTVFFDVAYQSYLPSIVERGPARRRQLEARDHAVGAQILGPGVAGILIGLLRAPFAMTLDAPSYLVGRVRGLDPAAGAPARGPTTRPSTGRSHRCAPRSPSGCGT